MKLNIKTLIVSLLALPFMFPALPAQADAPGAAGDPEYLIFQMSLEHGDFEGQVPQIKAEFGALPAGRPHYVGFGIALLTFTTPIEELRHRVTRALDHAEETGLPLLIELDDMNFLPEYSDPSMVEWTAFPKPGEKYGPPAKHYWLNWGDWMALPPPPNFESPAFRQEVAKRLKEGVLPPLLERLAGWKDQKRLYLFAGITIGWETGIAEYRFLRHAAVAPRDEKQQITMTAEEEGEQLGYASLYTLGWTQAKIEERARETGKSVEDVTTELLFHVIHDYTAFWAKTVNDAGIPKERIYTHGIAWESVPEQQLPFAWFRKSSRVPPVWVYVNPYCRPGYTMGVGEFEPQAFVRLLREAGATDGWGAVESYVRGVESEAAFGSYLRALFGHGAQLVDIYGWTAPGSPYDPMLAPGALRAMHAWLEGKELPAGQLPATFGFPGAAGLPGAETPAAGPLAPLQAKMERLQALMKQRQQEGTDMQPVSELMQGFEPLVQQRKFAEAEALLDRALKLASGSAATPALK